MKILAFESSAKAASVALVENRFLIAQNYQNNGLTHSTTLMPMAESLLKTTGINMSEIDCFAVAVGPGSFTGLRIGISTVKGLSWGIQKPCIGVSTLEAMAWQVSHLEGIICCAMDARRKQVYNALFRAGHGVLERLCEDRAVSLEDLQSEIKEYLLKEPVFLVGDGAELCYNYLDNLGDKLLLVPPHLRFQSAWGVACATMALDIDLSTQSAVELSANYLRLSQAERERLEKKKNEK